MSDWKRLNITDEQMEVLAHFSLRTEATDADRLREIWPTLPAAQAAQRLAAAVEGINRAASAATGKPGRVIAGNGSSFGPAVATPEVYVHVMVDEPYAEVR